MNRGKSTNSRYSSGTNIFNPRNTNSAGANSIFSMSPNFLEYSSYPSQTTSQLLSYVERCEDTDVIQNRDLLRRLCHLKNKDVLKETLSEYSRKGNFIRIFPAKGSDTYDVYFAQIRPLNRFMYKALYSNELFEASEIQASIPEKKKLMQKPSETIVVQLRMNNPQQDESTAVNNYISMPLEEVLAGVEDVVSYKMQSKIASLKERIETVRQQTQTQVSRSETAGQLKPPSD